MDKKFSMLKYMNNVNYEMKAMDSYYYMMKDLEKLCEINGRDFKEEYHVRMIGILFARASSQLTKDEILPNLKYFHLRSNKFVDFYCPGYIQVTFPLSSEHIVFEGGDGKWSFCDNSFNEIRKKIESITAWHYSGGVDLILTNATYWAFNGMVQLDFGNSISMNLDELKRNGAIISIEQLFEKICRFAEKDDPKDPTWGFSDKQGSDIAVNAIIKWLLSFLPKSIAEDVKQSKYFAIKDLRRKY